MTDNNTTTNQTKSKCIPCESLDKSTLLTQGEIQNAISSSIPLWSLKLETNSDSSSNSSSNSTNNTKGNMISRKFTAKNFQSALNFLNDVGQIAEREGHHPDLHLTSYRDVEIVIYTHSVGGLTKNDLVLAQMIDDEVKVVYSPKWLKEHPEAQVTV